MKKIIAFCGRMNSGKSMFSHYLCTKFDGECMTMAMALKRMLCELCPDEMPDLQTLNDKKDRQTEIRCVIDSAFVEKLSARCQVPYDKVCSELSGRESFTRVRDMLQFIGTDIIRKHNPMWHIDSLRRAIEASSSDLVCVDDIRFPNEREFVESMGGECYFVVRPNATRVANHEAETSLSWRDFNDMHIIINDTAHGDVYGEIEKLARGEYGNVCNLLLRAQQHYTQCNTNAFRTKTPLVERIIEQNRDRKTFTENGIIIYDTSDENEKNELLATLYPMEKMTHIMVQAQRKRFVFYNPLVFENLKRFL